ncbi:hypothetical protein [Vibrio breoganii]|uniref:hypothetical protein n=1 Tax=Vibrio breoganii TaxID=553239 RepID=UPI000C84A460|nr:hypothetical protein [Vibrio breoganii]PMK26298.1 hypothetical protein BCU03_19100 [Vibrio breoganii]
MASDWEWLCEAEGVANDEHALDRMLDSWAADERAAEAKAYNSKRKGWVNKHKPATAQDKAEDPFGWDNEMVEIESSVAGLGFYESFKDAAEEARRQAARTGKPVKVTKAWTTGEYYEYFIEQGE